MKNELLKLGSAHNVQKAFVHLCYLSLLFLHLKLSANVNSDPGADPEILKGGGGHLTD